MGRFINLAQDSQTNSVQIFARISMSKITASENRNDILIEPVTGTTYAGDNKKALDVHVLGGQLAGSSKIIIIDNASASITYYGYANPGTANSDATWRILRKEVVSASVTEFKYADGNDNYDNVWNNRASLTYS